VRSRELLRRLVGAYTGMAPGAVELRIGEEGKPCLAAGPVRFNLTHSGPAWVAAFALEREVGIDVERLDRDVDRERVAARIFAPREIETIRRLEGPAKTLAFFRCWTAREAIVKARGEGMFTLAARFEVDADPDHPLAIHSLGSEAERFRVGEVPSRAGCCAALATEGDVTRILAFEIASD
jgi:4'-phosphopantetheinyl transferase